MAILRGKMTINHQILGTPFSETQASYGVKRAMPSVSTQSYKWWLAGMFSRRWTKFTFMLLAQDYNRWSLGMP